LDFKDKANLIPFQAWSILVGLEETFHHGYHGQFAALKKRLFPVKAFKSSIFGWDDFPLPCLITRGCRSCWCSSSGGGAHAEKPKSGDLPTMGNDVKRIQKVLYHVVLLYA